MPIKTFFNHYYVVWKEKFYKTIVQWCPEAHLLNHYKIDIWGKRVSSVQDVLSFLFLF